MKRWIWGKTGYARRYDRQDIKGQSCAVREEGCSLSMGGLFLQAVIQVNDRNVHRSCPVAGIECAATPPSVITGHNTARVSEHEVVAHKQTAFVIPFAQQYAEIRLS